jgi:hypothetical protein
MTTHHCPCGRLVTAGWTAGNTGTDHCLLCVTARVMARVEYPALERQHARQKMYLRRKKAHNG